MLLRPRTAQFLKMTIIVIHYIQYYLQYFSCYTNDLAKKISSSHPIIVFSISGLST